MNMFYKQTVASLVSVSGGINFGQARQCPRTGAGAYSIRRYKIVIYGLRSNLECFSELVEFTDKSNKTLAYYEICSFTNL
jgi:hypothetical protein